jgi:hypothetical protein
MRVWLLVLSVAVILAGCSRIQPVEREQVAIGQGLSVQGSRIWNHFPTGTLGADAAWTQDGLPLDHVLFIAGRPDGEPLFERSRSRRSLQFRSNMTATEIAELWETELALGEHRQVEVGAPEPKAFAGHPGFRFAYSYATEAGMVFDGSATGAVVAGRLYLIAFSGTRAHHYPAHWPAAQHLIRSAQVLVDR